MAKRFASNDLNVVICGETGTGKEMFAQSIHNASGRKNSPFIAINCASLVESLLESELFGYIDGAFTGAARGGKLGLFELAHHGTLFLDEISEVSLPFQSKLLRVLQEHEVRRIGDDKFINIDVRIIASTNKELRKLVEKGLFREDLLYRLDVLRLYIPPLRERNEDIVRIFMSFMVAQCERMSIPVPEISREAMREITDYPFYGNVRELRNIAERIVVITSSGTITQAAVHSALYPNTFMRTEHSQSGTQPPNANDSQRMDLIVMLNNNNYNLTATAKVMGINRSTLWRRLKKYGIAKRIEASVQ